MQSVGVVYLATGGEQQVQLLGSSREQLRLRHPELDQHVISDDELRAESRVRRAGEEWRGGWAGTAVVVAAGVARRLGSVSVTRVRQARGFASRAYKTRVNRYSPFEQSLYLDTDTIVTRRLDELWGYLQRAPLAAALDIVPTVGRAVQLSLKDKLLSREEADVTVCECGENAPYFNTGVLLWRRCPETDRLFDAWHREWQRFGKRDQFAFARALFRCRMRIAVLPRKYNVPVVPGVAQGEIDDGCILHFWLPPKLERMKEYCRVGSDVQNSILPATEIVKGSGVQNSFFAERMGHGDEIGGREK